MPLGYLGTMISSSIIPNQPEHQEQPGMKTAIDCDDSHHQSCCLASISLQASKTGHQFVLRMKPTQSFVSAQDMAGELC